MQLLEFQAKELCREYGINLLGSISSTNIEEGRKHAKELEIGRASCRERV